MEKFVPDEPATPPRFLTNVLFFTYNETDMKISRFLRNILISVIFVFALFSVVKPASASEGTVELRSATTNSYRCFVASVQMIDLKYRVLVTCRDLLYPAGDDIFTYMLWGTPVSGKSAIKFGELGLGRAEFRIKTAFSNLFVTTEKNAKTKEPTGPVIMKGNVKRIAFLDNKVSAPAEEEIDAPDEVVASPSPTLSTKDRLVAGLRKAGVASLLALVAVFGLVFVLTRGR